jgi:hypothetical protein
MIWILEIFKLCYGVKIKFNKTVKGIKIPDCTGGAICTKTYHGKLNYKQTLTRHCKLLRCCRKFTTCFMLALSKKPSEMRELFHDRLDAGLTVTGTFAEGG